MRKLLTYLLDFLGLALLLLLVGLPIGVVLNLNPKVEKPQSSAVLGTSNTDNQLIKVEFGQADSFSPVQILSSNSDGRSIEISYAIKDKSPETMGLSIGEITNITDKEIKLEMDLNGNSIIADQSSSSSNSNFVLKPGQKVNLAVNIDEVNKVDQGVFKIKASYN